MKREDIIEKFKDVTRNDVPVPLANIVQIQKHVKATLEMDRDKLTYFYQIYVEDLEKSDIPEEILNEMVKEGWILNENKNLLTKTF